MISPWVRYLDCCSRTALSIWHGHPCVLQVYDGRHEKDHGKNLTLLNKHGAGCGNPAGQLTTFRAMHTNAEFTRQKGLHAQIAIKITGFAELSGPGKTIANISWCAVVNGVLTSAVRDHICGFPGAFL